MHNAYLCISYHIHKVTCTKHIGTTQCSTCMYYTYMHDIHLIHIMQCTHNTENIYNTQARTHTYHDLQIRIFTTHLHYANTQVTHTYHFGSHGSSCFRQYFSLAKRGCSFLLQANEKLCQKFKNYIFVHSSSTSLLNFGLRDVQ